MEVTYSGNTVTFASDEEYFDLLKNVVDTAEIEGVHANVLPALEVAASGLRHYHGISDNNNAENIYEEISPLILVDDKDAESALCAYNIERVLGLVKTETDRRAEALNHFMLATTLLETLFKRDEEKYRFDMFKQYRLLAMCYRDNGETDKYESCLLDADTLRVVITQDEITCEDAAEVANFYAEVAGMYLARGESNSAVDNFLNSARLYTMVAENGAPNYYRDAIKCYRDADSAISATQSDDMVTLNNYRAFLFTSALSNAIAFKAEDGFGADDVVTDLIEAYSAFCNEAGFADRAGQLAQIASLLSAGDTDGAYGVVNAFTDEQSGGESEAQADVQSDAPSDGQPDGQ